jgi:hypothetical protein
MANDCIVPLDDPHKIASVKHPRAARFRIVQSGDDPAITTVSAISSEKRGGCRSIERSNAISAFCHPFFQQNNRCW